MEANLLIAVQQADRQGWPPRHRRLPSRHRAAAQLEVDRRNQELRIRVYGDLLNAVGDIAAADAWTDDTKRQYYKVHGLLRGEFHLVASKEDLKAAAEFATALARSKGSGVKLAT